ncbi:MAG: hypothetical protein JWO03_2331 [Bacteroidetes bacterium]|nr:hypothetical protein [Bacteroidota bacterium]
MRIKILLIFLAIVDLGHMMAQSANKLTGPLAIYHISSEYTYSDSMGIDSIPMQDEFRFGEMEISNERSDGRFRFKSGVDSCISWHANRVMGIINPPSEKGVYNQPADTSLYFTHSVHGTGMIQGAQRFSRLSRLYGPFCGAIFDDWNGDTAITRDMYEALKGKYVDEDGNVYRESIATTPYNRLYTVLYSTAAQPAVMPYMDGLYFSYVDLQNCCYTDLDEDISKLKVNFPGKEIMIAIFLKNSHLGWTDPESIHYMLAHALDRYDDGDINQVCFFAGVYLVRSGISIGQWDSIALPHWLDSLYYPYLGQGQGRIYDCNTGVPLSHAFVRVFCEGRMSGDTLFRSRQMTDAEGHYQSGLWAGNRNTDSTYYWLVAEKEGYYNDTVGFWIKRGSTTTIPDVSLCAAPDPLALDNMIIFPNPGAEGFNVRTNAGGSPGDELEVYNMIGEKTYTTIQTGEYSYVSLSDKPDGVYVIALRASGREVSRKRVVLLRQ